ncbi:uncharacterized protein LOC107608333 [Arachis ipaensis]|uniref:uncharacterized protein LOC107608333 n=1 Tax=Arachis ipaensis TaxID=130454 RepID=UPI0007AFD1FF|nr:uncharacterized protein LOC107608333 [Arachis ipaensis]XP_025668692.1 uncharacterized protein LOC112767023 [Arachis hypogaea]QHN92321.1 uncharacterized protein DS421_17g582720 [Arachis hypogaea]
MSHAREPSSLRVKDAHEKGRSRTAAAVQPASSLSPFSSPPQAPRALSSSQARLPLSQSQGLLRSITVASSSSYFSHQRLLRCELVSEQSLVNIEDAILRQFDDKDMTIVLAALSVDGLENVIGSYKLFDALQNVLRRCSSQLLSGGHDVKKICSIHYNKFGLRQPFKNISYNKEKCCL